MCACFGGSRTRGKKISHLSYFPGTPLRYSPTGWSVYVCVFCDAIGGEPSQLPSRGELFMNESVHSIATKINKYIPKIRKRWGVRRIGNRSTGSLSGLLYCTAMWCCLILQHVVNNVAVAARSLLIIRRIRSSIVVAPAKRLDGILGANFPHA